MSEVLHANIFFFIASFSTILVTILVCIILYLVIKILNSVRALLQRIEEGSESLADDIASMRAFVTNGGLISKVFRFVMSHRTNPRSQRRKQGKEIVITDEE